MSDAAGIRAGRAFVEVAVSDKLSAGLDKAKARLKELERQVKASNSAQAWSERIIAQEAGKAKAATGALVAGLTRAQTQLAAFGAGVKASGQSMVMGSVAALTPIAASMTVFAGFEQSMARVRALTRATGEDFGRLNAKAQQLGRDTKFMASDAADAMAYFALAGFDVNKILTVIGPTLDLAAAGNMNVAQAADIAAKIMAGMGVEAAHVGAAIDVMTKAMTTANTDLPMLGDAMKFVGPIAKTAGVSLEETVAAIQMLSNAGIQGEMAGTTLRGVILSLTSPSEQAAQVMGELGVHVQDAQGNFRRFADILDDFNSSMKGMGSGQRLEILGRVFDARQAAGIAELLSQGGAQLRKFTAALQDAGGTAARIAAVQLDTFKGTALILWSSIEGLAIQIGQALTGSLRALGDVLIGVTNATAQFVTDNQALVIGVTAAAVSVGTLGLALTALGVALKTAAFAFGTAAVVTKSFAAALAILRGALASTSLAFASLGATVVVIGGAITAVVAVIGGLAYWAAASTRKVAELATSMQDARKAGDDMRATDTALIDRLQVLAQKQRLSKEEMAESRTILDKLTGHYGNFGVTLDATTGTLNVAAGAFDKLAQAMLRMRQVEVQKELAEVRENIQRVNDEIQNAIENTKLNPFSSEDKRAAEIAEGVKKRNAEYEKLQALVDLEGALEDQLAGKTPAKVGTAPGAPGVAAAPAVADAKAAADTEMEWSRKVAQLRIEQIEDEHVRAVALLDERYAYELQKATEAGAGPAEIAHIGEAHKLERAGLDRAAADQRVESQEQLEHELRALRIAGIEDAYDREVAGINERYDYEVAQAQRARDANRQTMLEKMRDAEIQNAIDEKYRLRAEERTRIATANAEQAATVEELKLQSTLKGLDLEMALLALQRKRALEAARTGGLNLDLVNREYDLREKMARAAAAVAKAGETRTSIMSTFDVSAAWGFGGQSAQDKTVGRLDKLIDHVRRIGEKVGAPLDHN